MPGRPKIEDDRGVVLGIAAEPCVFALAFAVDHVARRRQRAFDVGGYLAVVLDKQHAHHFSRMRPISPVAAST